jgi:hypothetical protein
MHFRRSSHSPSLRHGFFVATAVGAVLSAVGCANPGPPRPPSLRLPQPVRDLAAERVGDHVELRFTTPERTTDKLPIRSKTITASLCRGVEHQACADPGARLNIPIGDNGGAHGKTTWQDPLPTDLATGQPRLLAYRIELFNAAGKSAGKSDAAYTVAGAAPQRVDGFAVQGSRLGAVLHWASSSSADESVAIEREDLRPAKETARGKKDGVVWLAANASAGATSTLDTTALPDVPYRYTAIRRRVVRFGGRTIELSSEGTIAPEFTLREVYPPPVPTDLTVAGFTDEKTQRLLVDLVWQPVDEAGLVTKLAGYNLYRETVGGSASARVRLNTVPVPQPSFRDDGAQAGMRYRYSVSAVDVKGNESLASAAVVEAAAQ